MVTLTVRLRVSDYSQLSDYNCAECLVKNKSANAPITVAETLMVMSSPENSRDSPNQSDATLKLTTTKSPGFFRALGSLIGIGAIVSSFPLIGCCYYYGFVF